VAALAVAHLDRRRLQHLQAVALATLAVALGAAMAEVRKTTMPMPHGVSSHKVGRAALALVALVAALVAAQAAVQVADGTRPKTLQNRQQERLEQFSNLQTKQ
jgi:hypothetical protein